MNDPSNLDLTADEIERIGGRLLDLSERVFRPIRLLTYFSVLLGIGLVVAWFSYGDLGLAESNWEDYLHKHPVGLLGLFQLIFYSIFFYAARFKDWIKSHLEIVVVLMRTHIPDVIDFLRMEKWPGIFSLIKKLAQIIFVILKHRDHIKGSKDYLMFISLFCFIVPLYWLVYLIITPVSIVVLLFHLF